MKWNENLRRLDALRTLLGTWHEGAAPDEVERDLALDLLRKTYADIKFAAPAPAPAVEPQPAPEPEHVQVPIEDAAPETKYEPLPAVEPDHDHEPPRVELVVDQFVAEEGDKKKDVRQKLMSLYDDTPHAEPAHPANTLREAIGLNDKFLMIRDMFGSDSAMFDRTIDRLDEFTDLDDAMVWIYENFAWNPDDEGVRILVDLLTRKLG